MRARNFIFFVAERNCSCLFAQKKRPCTDAEPFNFRQRSSLDALDVLCRRAFLAIDYFKFYAFAFSESLEALALDRGMMDKYVLAAILFDKTKTF
jgi:hypothetical protein